MQHLVHFTRFPFLQADTDTCRHDHLQEAHHGRERVTERPRADRQGRGDDQRERDIHGCRVLVLITNSTSVSSTCHQNSGAKSANWSSTTHGPAQTKASGTIQYAHVETQWPSSRSCLSASSSLQSLESAKSYEKSCCLSTTARGSPSPPEYTASRLDVLLHGCRPLDLRIE